VLPCATIIWHRNLVVLSMFVLAKVMKIVGEGAKRDRFSLRDRLVPKFKKPSKYK
jgi:hypothetical protein